MTHLTLLSLTLIAATTLAQDSYTSNAIDADGGAAGESSGSFNLSKGGLIAIIVVVVSVAILGIASVVLFILAKRRQWNVRQSIKRASRRLTGRTNPPRYREEAARKERSGMMAVSKAGGTRAAYPPGQKRAVVVDVSDEEKGPLNYPPPPAAAKPSKTGWSERMRGNDWK